MGITTPYSGNANGGPNTTPAPAPGAVPIVQIQNDGYVITSANSFQQPLQTLADGITYINKTAGLSPPYMNSGHTGFTSVSHVGSGGGTVTPSGSVKINTGTNFVIKIILGGAVATATFQSSIDGGANYGATQTTAASMTDATSGVTLAFSGSFVAADTYQWHSAFTPLMTYADSAGNIRHLMDHNGFRMGRVSEWYQDWNGMDFSANRVPTGIDQWIFGDGYNWTWNALNTNSSVGLVENSYAGFTTCAVYQGVSTNVSGTYNIIKTKNMLFVPTANTCAVAEWEMFYDYTPGNSEMIWQIGFTNNTTNTALSSDSDFMIEQITTDTTWYIRTANGSGGGSSNRVNTGVTIDHTTCQRFRLELYGSATPYGALARVFINEQGPFEVTTPLPFDGSGLGLFWCQRGHYVTGTAPTQFMYTGPLRIVYARYLSSPAL